MSHIKLDADVTEILQRSEIKENVVILPPGQLERKFYERIAKAINAAGGAWNRKHNGFLFPSDPCAKLGLALEAGIVVDEKKVRQAFYTPQAIADEIALLADVAAQRVLEPSAGAGALASAAAKFGAAQVDCIEQAEECREQLTAQGFPTTIADFLTLPPQPIYDRVIMNPPFTKGQDRKHLEHAARWLKPGGRLFAILPDKECPKIAALGAYTVKRFPAGAFKESGTSVRTRLVTIEASRTEYRTSSPTFANTPT